MKTGVNIRDRLCNEKIIYVLMIFIAICLSIKYIFIDLGIDAEYQVVMAYRLATGDVMFREMWEAHQTSAFVCAFFIKIFLLLFHTTTGIVLYLQLIGVLIDGAIAVLLYKVVNKYLHSTKVAFGMAWVFYIVSPKDVPIAEFANMQIWFCMLLCIMLFLYYETKRKRFLMLAALSLCLAVLSYPSCVILLVGVGFLLFRWGEKRDFFIVIGICIITGLLYIAGILKTVSINELLFCVENMLAIEPTHTVGIMDKFVAYAKDATKIAVVFLLVYGISYVIAKWICRFKKWDKEIGKLLADALFYMLILVICLYTIIYWQAYIRFCYSLSFLAVILVGTHYVKKLSADKFYFYLCGTSISFLNFIATLILTDLEIVSSLPYLLIALTMAFLPIAEACKDIKGKEFVGTLMRIAVICGVVFLTFRNAYIIRPMNAHIQTIMEIGGIVKEGPAAGIISEYMGAYMQNESIKEWEQYIEEGSNIYLIGNSIDTLGYLYANTEIAAPSVMSTPGYNGSISKYWEINADKYPDVVIASCWFGNLDPGLEKNEWIMKWLEEDFRPQYYIDGKYWRYYFR